MPRHCANVNYVEPNYSSADWKADDGYDRSPRLEDYCVMFNIEVEVFNRDNIVNNSKEQSQVLIMSCQLDRSTSATTVNFLSGTKVECHDKGSHFMRYATTNYADMYVGDLVDYGTTEMIGVKSVDVEYEKSCVPIVTIQFTDVRGMSLFQPTELNRNDTYDGIRGLDVDNIAQTFFQCFFKLPTPKYTIYLKGFYGKPVCYEVMCDKFDTKFNSATGDFDVTARFIGYNYSFLTDVSMDALVAAPYSDYYGESYWKNAISDGRFTIWNKDKTQKLPIPTLVEIRNTMTTLLKETNPSDTPLTAEDKYHVSEINDLNNLRLLYQSWYSALYLAMKDKYGSDLCYLFKNNGGSEEFYRILLLTSDTDMSSNLGGLYNSLGNDFKKVNNDLFSAVENYNSNATSIVKLNNVSLDFTDYKLTPLFNRMYLNDKGDVVFNGFDSGNELGETDVINRVFFGVDYSNDDDFKVKRDTHKRHVLSKLYGDGVNQIVNCYVIDVPYEGVTSRLNALQSDANSNPKEKEHKARVREMNRFLLDKMGWYPSVENFTKIMLAHMETLMHMMYKVASDAHGRTVTEMGGTVGSNGNYVDVNSNSSTIPPFPRVTREVIGDDNITKREDAWIGDFSDKFVEIDMINGLFNGIDKANMLMDSQDIATNETSRDASSSASSVGILKHPIAPFDLFIKKSPYGDASEMINDLSGKSFAARVVMRMYALLNINYLTYSEKGKMLGSDGISKIAESEAENFYSLVKITNPRFLDLMNGGELSPSKIIEKVKSQDQSNPWGSRVLFDGSMNLVGYASKNGSYIYPIQNDSFSSINKSLSRINANSFTFSDSYIDKIGSKIKYDKYSKGTYGLGSCAILDSHTDVDSIMSTANSTMGDGYSLIYDALSKSGYDSDATEIDNMISMHSFDQNKILSHISGFKKNGSASIQFDEESQFIDIALTESPINEAYKNIILDGTNFGERAGHIARALCGLVSNGLSNALLRKNAFIRLPKYCALKVGAIISASNTIYWGNDTSKIIRLLSCKLPLANGNYGGIIKAIRSMTPMERAQYAKYFLNWAQSSDGTKFLDVAMLPKYYNIDGNTKTLKSNDDTVVSVSRDLCKDILIVRLSSFSNRNIPLSKYTAYLDSFMKKLNELYGVGTRQDLGTSNATTVAVPNKTNDDMKKGLYAYLKLLYDKWVPTSSFGNWKIENYFEDSKKSEENGDTFYFIDSYYNKIGDKLLINPQKLAEKIGALLSYQDVNVMMLGFMADIYSQNKCMLMAIQNFADLSKKGTMDEMFKPLPYNSIDWSTVNKHPSFVVVYPYEPSKHLNVANSEYNDDSFMLNDENETPIAIRSKSGDGMYYIPAFGVSYGKQYQSYFKSVDIDMQSPIATQQSIKAKHYILRDANDTRNAVGVGAQDLYDIYSTNSYMCNVTMMGCAWVQPMMYFVLLNVPMFRGSYLIMKVKHHLTPGNMETTFSGCRMSYVSNSLVEDIFTDDNYSSASMYSNASREELADVDNNCPYMIYPLFQESYDGISYTFPSDSSHMSFARTMFAAYKKARPSLNDDVVKGLIAQDAQESGWGTSPHGKNNFGEIMDKGRYLSYSSVDDFVVNGKYKYLDNKFKGWDKEVTTASQYVKRIQRDWPKWCYAGDKYYYQHIMNDDYKEVCKLLGGTQYKAPSRGSSSLSNVDVANALFEALQKSVNSTPSISIELKKTFMRNDFIMVITQSNGNNDYLANVFDLLLNGYYDYIRELYWVYPSNGGNGSDPAHIDVVVGLGVEPNKKRVYVCQSGNIESSKSYKIGQDANKKLRLSLLKKFGDVNKEVPQVVSSDTYKGLSLADCSSIINATTMGSSSSVGGSIEKKKIELFGESWSGSKPKQWCESFLKQVEIKYRTSRGGALETHKVRFHKKLEGNLQAVFNELANLNGFYVENIGTYSYRNVIGKSKLSNHSYGIALDLNTNYNPYYRNGKIVSGGGKTDQLLSMRSQSNEIVKIFARHGFGWGGSYKDYMHFSYFDGH